MLIDIGSHMTVNDSRWFATHQNQPFTKLFSCITPIKTNWINKVFFHSIKLQTQKPQVHFCKLYNPRDSVKHSQTQLPIPQYLNTHLLKMTPSEQNLVDDTRQLTSSRHVLMNSYVIKFVRQILHWRSDIEHGKVGGLDPLKICRRVRVCFDPHKMSRSFIQKCFWITQQVSHHQGRKMWNVKPIFRGAWKSLMSWPDWPWPPYFTTALRHCRPL